MLVPTLSGEADVTEAEKTIASRRRAWPAPRRREIPVCVLLNRVRRTQLARHAAGEEIMPPPTCRRWRPRSATSVAYGELSYSGRIPAAGTAATEIAELLAELRERGWLPPRVATAHGRQHLARTQREAP